MENFSEFWEADKSSRRSYLHGDPWRTGVYALASKNIGSKRKKAIKQ